MILADYHLHTSFSSDSESPMEEKLVCKQVPIFCPNVIKIADLQFTIPLIANVCKIPTDADEL